MDSFNLLKDNEIINLVSRNQNYLNKSEIVDRILNFNINNFILFFKNVKDVTKLLLYKDKIINLTSNYFNIIYLNISDELKKTMIYDNDYLKKIVTSEQNKLKKDLFDLSSINIKQLILSREKELNIIDENLFENYTNRLKLDEISFLQSKIENNDVEQKLNNLKIKFNISDKLYNSLLQKLNNKERSIISLYKFKNLEEIYLYDKFGILLEVDNIDNNISIGKENIFTKELLEKINIRHMNIIINKIIQDNENQKKDYNKIFTVAIKLYSIFGFDNTMKILNNKFTYMNKKANTTISKNIFTKERRKYRLENQNKFYSNDMLEKTIEAINNKDLYYFCNICPKEDEFLSSELDLNKQKEIISYDDILISYMEDLIKVFKAIPDDKKRKEEISKLLKETINSREIKLCNNFIKNYEKKIEIYCRKDKLNYNELYELFKGVNIQNFKLDTNGRFIINSDLTKFLLGNEKYDNDCLLRLILNNVAFGLEKNLSYLINNFSKIKKIAENHNNLFSINSILDIIDICKARMYKLQPNEKDLTFETITKIQNSYQFCLEPQEDIFKRTKELYLKSKKKVSSTIPSVEGITKDNIKYEVLKFDDQSLITVGIDTENCLRVGGKGEEFLNYCITSQYAVIVGFWDEFNKFYMCPFIRNGNGIYGNGIDPKPENEHKSKIILEALQMCVNRIINISFEQEKIEFATITDLHQEEFFKKQNIPTIKIDKYLPINDTFYSDYNKENLKHYIISEDNNFKIHTYIPETMYFQKRRQNYIYSKDTKNNNEDIQVIINSIAYENINCIENLSKKVKNSKKRNFEQINIENYEYVVGNKDWYILIDKNFNLKSDILPYDPRAKLEYDSAYNYIKNNIMKGNIESGDKGKNY